MFTVWLTGLPSSGKTTIAKELVIELKDSLGPTVLLDGDVVRDYIENTDFSMEGRLRHLDYMILQSKILNDNDIISVCSFVSPYQITRDRVKENIEDCYIVYVKCPVEKCIERDVKGLYKKALDGKIKGFTGIDGIYEEPPNPDLIVETDKEEIQESVDKILMMIYDS